ncbi:MAG: endonuclease domain-containing protein, partial [Betaproteobacteria bacterium]|nr:endonuclease domain-containing protein [Betaproteobacteria bacterium]
MRGAAGGLAGQGDGRGDVAEAIGATGTGALGRSAERTSSRQGRYSLSPHRGERAGVRGVEFARNLRRTSTDAEQRLWHRLRGAQLHGCKFRRQHPIGPWFADFACIERRLVVELDGGQHVERAAYDCRRTEWLRLAGWRVARFWDNEVLKEMDA